MKRRSFIALTGSPLLIYGRQPDLQGVDYVGKIESELVPEFAISGSKDLPTATSSERAPIDLPVEKDTRIYSSTLDLVDKTEPIRILLLETPQGESYLLPTWIGACGSQRQKSSSFGPVHNARCSLQQANP